MRARRLTAASLALLPLVAVACSWDPSRPFEREAPPVREAIAALDGGDATTAANVLEEYLSTGACKEGAIGLPEPVRRLPNGSFDLGLALFRVGESFGGRFGDEEYDAGLGDEAHQRRASQIACALEVAQHVASDGNAPLDLRARARYLEGNLDFLGSDYEAAVKAYDEAIRMAPGVVDAGDSLGRDAAWNRAIALRRIEDQKDAGNDASPPPNDGSSDAPQPDSGHGDASSPDGGKGPGDSGSPSPPDSGSNDAGEDGSPPPPPPSPPDAGPAPAPKESQDDRVLDQLENAPTVQQEDVRRHSNHRRVRNLEDK